MGEAELYTITHQLVIRSTFYFYGGAATWELAHLIASEIALIWNEPKSDQMVLIRKEWYEVQFEIDGIYDPDLMPETVWYNTNPRCNYFRIEDFSQTDIYFVDGLGSNTGYFKLG